MKIFSDSTFIVPDNGHVAMLYPFWGMDAEDSLHPAAGRFDDYIKNGQRDFEMVSLEDAEIAVLPMPWERVETSKEASSRAHEFLELAKAAGKKTLIFYWSDSASALPYEETVVFRTSLYRSRRQPNEFAMPAWSEDFVREYMDDELPIREKRSVPVVGFCGFAAPLKSQVRWGLGNLVRKVIELLQRSPSSQNSTTPGSVLRARSIRILSRSHAIEANFAVRRRFLAGALLPDGTLDYDRYRSARREYVQNMVDSDYILCIRGGGNFSYRLYETMSCGRIPVFVDTDCVLPYDWEIDWKDYCVWIDEQDIGLIAKRVKEFHDALDPYEFADLQERCRRLWEERLSPEGFFKSLHRHLQDESAPETLQT